MEQEMPKKNPGSIMGEAPKMAAIVMPVLAVAIAASILWPRYFRFEGALRGAAFAAGVELAAVGLVFWVSAAWRIIAAFKSGRLATRGAYALCRHPIFSWWIFSVLPALALMANSWLFIGVAVVFYAVASNGAQREETELAARFGDEFQRYASKVRMLVPFPRLRPFTTKRYAKALLDFVLLAAFMVAVLFVIVKPIALGFGATPQERAAPLPGDENIARAWGGYTQAVDIEAPAGEVWKWLAQVGYKRAGWYNIDAINRLAAKDYFIDGSGSSTRIVPELQNPSLGDRIEIVPGMGFVLTRLEPPKLLVMVGNPDDPNAESNAAWTFVIVEKGVGACRLVTRFRSAFSGGFGAAVANDIIGFIGGAVIQQPAMFQGLKSRAEKAYRSR